MVDSDRAEKHLETDYLDHEVNLLKPATPFMRDHLKVVWAGFLAWLVVVFGPVLATAVAPVFMTETTVLGFPLHYFLVSLASPGGALVLSGLYARKRDQLDRAYGIGTGAPTGDERPVEVEEPAVADGGDD